MQKPAWGEREAGATRANHNASKHLPSACSYRESVAQPNNPQTHDAAQEASSPSWPASAVASGESGHAHKTMRLALFDAFSSPVGCFGIQVLRSRRASILAAIFLLFPFLLSPIPSLAHSSIHSFIHPSIGPQSLTSQPTLLLLTQKQASCAWYPSFHPKHSVLFCDSNFYRAALSGLFASQTTSFFICFLAQMNLNNYAPLMPRPLLR